MHTPAKATIQLFKKKLFAKDSIHTPVKATIYL